MLMPPTRVPRRPLLQTSEAGREAEQSEPCVQCQRDFRLAMSTSTNDTDGVPAILLKMA